MQPHDASIDFPPAPPLVPMTRIECEVAAIQSLGAAPGGERRFVPLTGGRVFGPELNGAIVEGGVDWQWLRADGAIDIAAHYAIRADDGSLIEVNSLGVRVASPEVMAQLARGQAVGRDAMYFRTAIRFTTGAPAWQHLNRVIAIACGARDARLVRLDLYRVG
jgi:Protein of unknown function (DUF3237)